jgi:hypothetical protein
VAAAFGDTRGLAFLLSAGVVAEFIAKDASSPQTAEINIRKRAGTLMKWVHIGQVEAAFFVAIAAIIDKQNRWPILAGGVLSMLITEGQYQHAKTSGLASLGGPETEQY